MRTTSAALLLAVLLQLAACGVAPSNTGLRLSISADPSTFDPLHESDENSGVVLALTGGTLLRIDSLTDEVQPELAQSWTVDPAGRSITFRLRSGLKFSNGAALTADDVARTLRSAFDPANASPVGDPFRSDQGFPAVEVVSPQQITIRYTATKAGLERLFDQVYIAPARQQARAQTSSLPVPAAGPFFVADYRVGEAVLLKRNPYYWKRDSTGRQLPYLDSIRLDIQSNRDIEIARFLRGETNMIRKLDPEGFNRVSKERPAAARDLGPSMDTEFLWFNQSPERMPEWKRKWFTSADFRRAISAAIDRQDIARIAYLNHAHPAAGPLSPANRYWFNPELKPLTFDRDLAIRTLSAAGFTLSNNVLRDKAGHPVEFSLITNAGNTSRQQVAALVQADLKKIGIRVSIVTLDFGSLMERIGKTSQYDACLLGFTNMAVDPIDQMNFWLSSGSTHAWWPQQKTPSTDWEARMDQLVLAQASEPSLEKRRIAFNEVQRIMVQQEPVIYLVNPDFLFAADPSIRGIRPSPLFPQALAGIEWVSLK
jgi:peptide/nickel transport system substrate-binding protein